MLLSDPATSCPPYSGPAHIIHANTPVANSSGGSITHPWGPGSANPHAVLGQGSGLDLAGHCR